MVSFEDFEKKSIQEGRREIAKNEQIADNELKENIRIEKHKRLALARDEESRKMWENPQRTIDELEMCSREYVDFVNSCARDFSRESRENIEVFGYGKYSLVVERTFLPQLFGKYKEIGCMSVNDFSIGNVKNNDESYRLMRADTGEFIFLDDPVYNGIHARFIDGYGIIDKAVRSVFEPEIAARRINIGIVLTNSFVDKLFRLRDIIRNGQYRFGGEQTFQGHCFIDSMGEYHCSIETFTLLHINDYGSLEIPKITETYKKYLRRQLRNVEGELITLKSISHAPYYVFAP